MARTEGLESGVGQPVFPPRIHCRRRRNPSGCPDHHRTGREWFDRFVFAGAIDRRTCRPAGAPAADFQGPICAPGVDFDVVTAVKTCGAASYQFDHLLAEVTGFDQWVLGRQHSPYLDVSGERMATSLARRRAARTRSRRRGD